MNLSLGWTCKLANKIQHVHEPSRLILAWQAADLAGNRQRFAVGEVARQDSTIVLTYYQDSPDVREATELGYEGYAAFSLKERTHSKHVLEAFMRRLPPRSRIDFPQYLDGFRLSASSTISDFALLGYSEAKLPSDGFSLVDALDDVQGPSEFVWEIAGYRHYRGLTEAEVGSPVTLDLDPNNPFDPNAVQIRHKGRTIGYINRLQAPVVREWVQAGRVTASIERLNGTPERPKAFIFVRYE
jgi:hypothetical protein